MNDYDAHKESIKGRVLNAYELADAMDTKGFRYREVKAAVKLLRQQAEEIAELKAAVRSFFQDFLDIREESDSGRVFAPITISSCRCMMIEPLAEVLAKMRKLSGSEK
jgi:hypothetical protein